jgi:hypothetical protein
MSVIKLRIFKHGSIHEWSGIFRHRNLSTFGKGNTAVYYRSYKLPASRLFVGTGPSFYKKRIYRAAVSQILRNTVLDRSQSLFRLIYPGHFVYRQSPIHESIIHIYHKPSVSTCITFPFKNMCIFTIHTFREIWELARHMGWRIQHNEEFHKIIIHISHFVPKICHVFYNFTCRTFTAWWAN